MSPSVNPATKPRTLVVDLDGTLLHPEASDLPAPGISGVQYMSRRAADLLREISRSLPVIIATGRNARSVGRVLKNLSGISFRGFVLENGLLARTRLMENPNPRDRTASARNPNPLPSSRSVPETWPGTLPKKWDDPWAPICRRLPEWRRLEDYETCLGLLFPRSETSPRESMEAALADAGMTGHIWVEPRKVFVYPSPPGKLLGIRSLNVEPFIVLGDERNDIDLLRAAAHPGTLASAHPEVQRTVETRGGYRSRSFSHAGAEDLLRWAAALARSIR